MIKTFSTILKHRSSFILLIMLLVGMLVLSGCGSTAKSTSSRFNQPATATNPGGSDPVDPGDPGDPTDPDEPDEPITGDVFAIRIKINSASETFTLPTHYIYDAPYNWLVDWGDGSPLTLANGISDTFNEVFKHTYTNPKTYDIKIYPNGAFSKNWLQAFGWSFSFMPSKGQLVEILTVFPENSKDDFIYTFDGCENLNKVPEGLFDKIKNNIISFKRTFDSCKNLAMDINDIILPGLPGEYSQMKDTSDMFCDCGKLTGYGMQVINVFEQKNLENYSGTFAGCSLDDMIVISNYDNDWIDY